jgi:homopolymeric O-antigen transport system ATP-binding protein
MTTAIDLVNVSKVYRRYGGKQFSTLKSALLQRSIMRDFQPGETFPALTDVSFSVPKGSTFGVIGRNGSGKSTALKLVAGITKPTMGTVRVGGRISALIELGAGFHPEISGRENVFINGIMLGLSKREIARRFDEIVEFAEVARFLDTAVKHYSSGMYLRLAFAVAAHLRSEILVVDEVLAVGDAEFQAKCLSKMKDVASEGRTILFVSHNLNAIQRMCPRSILLEGGRLVADGSTPDVLQRYLALAPDSPEPNQCLDTSRLHRTGTREVYIDAVQYRSDSEEFGWHAYPDGPLELRLSLVSDLPRTIGSLGLSLHDEDGTTLVSADTISLGLVTSLERGRNVVGLRIDSLHLNPGGYHVALWARGPLGRLVFDRIESAFVLKVVDPRPAISRPRAEGSTTCRFHVLDST